MKTKENDARKRLMIRAAFIISIIFILTLLFSWNASASLPDEVESGLADALGVSTLDAGVILSALIIGAFVIALALFEVDLIVHLAVIPILVVACIALGWLQSWTIILIAILYAALFAGVTAGPFGRSSGGAAK